MTTDEMISAGQATWVLPLWGPDGSQQFVTPAEAASMSFDHFRAGIHARHNPDVAWGLMYAARYAATGDEANHRTAQACGVPDEVIEELVEVGIPVAWIEPLESLPREIDEQWHADPGIDDVPTSSHLRTGWVVRSSVPMWRRDGLAVPPQLAKYLDTAPAVAVAQSAARNRERSSTRRVARQLAGSDSDPPRLTSRVIRRLLRPIGAAD